jgi:hypothetical protein
MGCSLEQPRTGGKQDDFSVLKIKDLVEFVIIAPFAVRFFEMQSPAIDNRRAGFARKAARLWSRICKEAGGGGPVADLQGAGRKR